VFPCQPIDLLLIIDSSESITSANFYAIRAFASLLVGQFDVSPISMRVAGMTFNDIVYQPWSFTDYPTLAQLQAHINTLDYYVGNTNTSAFVAYILHAYMYTVRSYKP
jgi:hypothetical protein